MNNTPTTTIDIKATPRAERETYAWRIVVIYGLDGYNCEEIRQMTGIDTRQVKAMSQAKKDLLDTGHDPRDFDTWLSVMEHQKAEREAKAKAIAHSMPPVKVGQTFVSGKPTLWAMQHAPQALKDDARVPSRVIMRFHGDGHYRAGAEAWGREVLAPWKQKYQDVLDGKSEGFTGPPDPLSPKPLSDQRMWEEFRRGKTFSEVIRINIAVDQLRAREVEKVHRAVFEADHYGRGDPCNVSDRDDYAQVKAWLEGRPARIEARRQAEKKKQAEANAQRMPKLPEGILPDEEKAQKEEDTRTSRWPEGFGGDGRKKAAELADLTFIADKDKDDAR